MEITDLVRVGKSEQYKTYADGELVCKLEAETIVKHHIKIGSTFTDEEFLEIRQESEKLSCFSSGLAYISKALKTKKQVRDNLRQKGYLPQSIDHALEKLESYGYINDAYYAECFVRSNGDKKGELYLKQKLAEKGVSKAVIANALDGFECNFDGLLSLAEKFVKNKPKDKNTKQKLYRHLLSKGFSFEDSRKAVDKVFGGDDDWD